MGRPVEIVVGSDRVQALARRRAFAALMGIPVLSILGITIVAVDTSLALGSVVCAFFVFASISIFRRQRQEARNPAALRLQLEDATLRVGNGAPRTIVRAIERPEYVRLLCTSLWVARFWFDARRDPTAFIDVPVAPEDRLPLREALREAEVPITRESSLGRITGLAGIAVMLLCGLTLWRVSLGLAATMVGGTLGAPATLILLSVSTSAWLWRKTR